MKKLKLSLKKETLEVLDNNNMQDVHGGVDTKSNGACPGEQTHLSGCCVPTGGGTENPNFNTKSHHCIILETLAECVIPETEGCWPVLITDTNNCILSDNCTVVMPITDTIIGGNQLG